MSTKPSSLEKAFVAQHGDHGSLLGAASEPEQLDLLRDKDGKLPRDVFRQIRIANKSGPGRPAGARNRRSDDLVRMLDAKYPDPVLWMASLYAMPLDQMIELMLIADSTKEREERLLQVVDAALGAAKALKVTPDPEKIDKLTGMVERLVDMAKGLKSKPGDIAVKALNTQLQAARAVAEYKHSKKPVEVDAKIGVDGVIFMPAATALGDGPVSEVLKKGVEAVNDGRIDAGQLADLRIVEGEYVDVPHDVDDDDDPDMDV